MVRVGRYGKDPRRFEVDFTPIYRDGTAGRRVRKAAPRCVTSVSAARRWGERLQRERQEAGPPASRKEVPRLSEFAPVFLASRSAAGRERSSIRSIEQILRKWILPYVGPLRLNEIRTADTEAMKVRAHAAGLSRKTVVNHMTALRSLLDHAHDLELIDRLPRFRWPKVTQPEMRFYSPNDFEVLVEAAEGVSVQAHLVVLLGGEAGLRSGEVRALRWADWDCARGRLRIRRTVSGDRLVPYTKGGNTREVPTTRRLAELLSHQPRPIDRDAFVLRREDGRYLSQQKVWRLARDAEVAAGLFVPPANGEPRVASVHALRHTFCTRLVAQGADVKAIQKLAGHATLATTMRYMHHAPGATDRAIRLLEHGDEHRVAGSLPR